jgi:20S proteasome alpha/beta subunit
MAVAGSDFVVVAADTRLSFGYSIHTRYSPKIIQLYDNLKKILTLTRQYLVQIC